MSKKGKRMSAAETRTQELGSVRAVELDGGLGDLLVALQKNKVAVSGPIRRWGWGATQYCTICCKTYGQVITEILRRLVF